jgi:hypothetical protein
LATESPALGSVASTTTVLPSAETDTLPALYQRPTGAREELYVCQPAAGVKE